MTTTNTSPVRTPRTPTPPASPERSASPPASPSPQSPKSHWLKRLWDAPQQPRQSEVMQAINKAFASPQVDLAPAAVRPPFGSRRRTSERAVPRAPRPSVSRADEGHWETVQYLGMGGSYSFTGTDGVVPPPRGTRPPTPHASAHNAPERVFPPPRDPEAGAPELSPLSSDPADELRRNGDWLAAQMEPLLRRRPNPKRYGSQLSQSGAPAESKRNEDGGDQSCKGA